MRPLKTASALLPIAFLLLNLTGPSAWAGATDLFGTGLCYSSTAKSVVNGIAIAPETSDLRVRHRTALEASAAVYKLGKLAAAQPDLSVKIGIQKGSGRGYSIYRIGVDRGSGLQYTIFQPPTDRQPWILSFGGSDTVKSWIQGPKAAREQIRRSAQLLRLFTACEAADPAGLPFSQRPWILTGHSLGGAVAQAFAYVMQEVRAQLGLQPLSVELVTFNAFGPMTAAVGSTNPTPNYTFVNSLNASNYFVNGDPVSRVGRHIGSTVELPLPGVSNLTTEIQTYRHSLEGVREAAIKFPSSPFSLRFEKIPPPVKSSAAISLYGYSVRVQTNDADSN